MNKKSMNNFSHDGDGKIYFNTPKTTSFLFEVLIADGNAVAKRLNYIYAGRPYCPRCSTRLRQPRQKAHEQI